MRVVVTGSAGFIGFHVSQRFLELGHHVVGVDGITEYYDVNLKRRRLALLQLHKNYFHSEIMLENDQSLQEVFSSASPEIVVHLAAQAGVRYSIENPRSYVNSNIVGTFNVLEACRNNPVRHLVLASTSSAYGANQKVPFEETDKAIHPITLYAATKGATELMAHSYAHLFSIPTTAFRFFTVYGPWGRPDMAYFLFTKSILDNKPIEIFNNGESFRDFTYVDDLVESIMRLVEVVPPMPKDRSESAFSKHDTLSPVAPYRLVNIGGGKPVRLLDFVTEIEKALGISAIKQMRPLPPGDVPGTWASADLLQHLIRYKPQTPISVGIPSFVNWYKKHFN
jgi:UDP-glucuronate 4-epimerase